MSNNQLQELARAAGVNSHWTDAFGKPHQVSDDSLRAILDELGFAAGSDEQLQESLQRLESERRQCPIDPLLPRDQHTPIMLSGYAPGTPYSIMLEDGGTLAGALDAQSQLQPISECGYHRLRIGNEEATLAIAPLACPSVDELTGQTDARVWGITAQIYSLRRPGDGGLGDTGALEQLTRAVAARGADVLAISPLHAIFSPDAHNYSPYSPSSRIFYNILHSAPDLVLGGQAWRDAIAHCQLQEEMQRLESLPLIDWPAVSALRMRLLQQLYQDFRAAPNPLTAQLADFITQGGDALQQHCRFEALQSHLLGSGQPPDWHSWPAEFRDPHSTAVEYFASMHTQEIGFHLFAQWLSACSMERAHQAAHDAGMRIGLIADLAVGAHGAGSQTWSRQQEFLPAINVGAPPDILSTKGQNWGVAAFSPYGLRKCGFRAFIEMVRANLVHADGLRIDHIMGLQRLWIIPQGADPDQGAYLDYPFEEQLRLLSLEAWRHRALIIGEDLGTVPEGMREVLSRRNILGMRVMLFEQHDGRFLPPEQWSHDALATTTTHDLPSISGWLKGRDIDWRCESRHRSPEQTQDDRSQREREKDAMLEALRSSGQLDGDPDGALDASVGFIGSTPAPLSLLPLEDLMGTDEQPNLPGPGNTHPNWRRRWPVNVQEMLNYPQVEKRLRRLASARRAPRSEP